MNKLAHVLSIVILASFLGCKNQKASVPDLLLLDMVHDNPGEPPFHSAFKDPQRLTEWNNDGQVINDFSFVQTAVKFRRVDPNIIPEGSEAEKWVENRAHQIDRYIEACERAGIESLIFTDIIVLPTKIKEIYGDQVLDERGGFSLKKEKTVEIHRIMFEEIFERFPGLDGIVVRTGETYLNNMVHHTGNGPFEKGISRNEIIDRHVQLLNLLREEVCKKHYKKIIYRTWAFGGIHTDTEVYLEVTNQVHPHTNLYFSIKHTKGDYHRNFDFNPTIGIGKHQQIIEVQCQREYEGKSAHPNYIAESVINGFEEYKNAPAPHSLSHLKGTNQFAGLWTWSRGGGWKGPYIRHELWSEVNAYVLSQWVQDTTQSPSSLLNKFAIEHLELSEEEATTFEQLCRLSTKGVIRGRSSLTLDINPFWIRDEFMGGIVRDTTINNNPEKWGRLNGTFDQIVAEGKISEALEEKKEAMLIWEDIERLSLRISPSDSLTDKFLKVSSTYGRIKYSIIYHAWSIMLNGYYRGKEKGSLSEDLKSHVESYERLWAEWNLLAENEPLCPTLYKPYGFVYKGPDYHEDWGMEATINRLRDLQ